MAETTSQDRDAIANHTLAYLRSHGKKLDLILETLNRHGERLARLERDVGEGRRDLLEVKSDIALMENKVLSSQTNILFILHRLDDSAIPAVDHIDPPGPGPTSASG